jgi:hypothetical protein
MDMGESWVLVVGEAVIGPFQTEAELEEFRDRHDLAGEARLLEAPEGWGSEETDEA